jgi:CobQ-like glutamine amidotransferase family enzyme
VRRVENGKESKPELRIGYLYSSGMNVYGDRGNVTCLVQRCRWRGITVEVAEYGVGEHVPFESLDLVFAGGGQDRDQIAVSRDLQSEIGRAFKDAVDDGLVVLTVCGTYQLLGKFFRTGDGSELPGIGIFDAWTIAGPRRYIGDTVVTAEFEGRSLELIGFENHSGRTYLGPAGEALGRVVIGAGNNGEDGFEGARYRNAFGTYLHGPILPKNPGFADQLIRLALLRRHGNGVTLSELDDSAENTAHRGVVDRVRRRGRVKSGAI